MKKKMMSYNHTQARQSRIKYLRFLPLCLFILGSSIGCQPIPWKLYRTVNPYSKTQLPNPYGNTLHASGGAEFSIRKFYISKTIACMVLRVDSKNAYAEVYVNPHKAQLVAGKFGIRAMKSTMAAREPLYRKMVQNFYKIKDPKSVPRWSKYYFRQGTIPGKKSRTGMLCFQLQRNKNDSEKLVINKQCRMQLTGVMVAKGAVTLGWMHFAPMK